MNHVVVGSGLTGLVSAALLARRVDPARVHVVEGAPVVGGLLRSFDHGEHGLFDVGTHLLSELDIPEVDEILLGALPDDEWTFHAGPKRDPAATWFDGRLNTESPYLDLRGLPRDEWVRCAGGLFDALDDPVPPPGSDAGAVARARFGSAIVERAIGPAAEKVHRWPLADLDPSALALTPLDRVVLFPEEPFGDLMASDLVRSRVGHPSQWTMPDRYRSPLRAFYPRRRGMQRFVDGLAADLRARGVHFHIGTAVGPVSRTGDRVTEVTVDGRALPVDRLLWTSGLHAALSTLGLPFPGIKPDPQLTTAIVSVVVRDRPDTGGAFYAYSYDPEHVVFRVSNYAEYCPDGAQVTSGWPVTIEVLSEEPVDDPSALGERAVREAAAMGIVGDEPPAFVAVEVLRSGFPRLTRTNAAAMAGLRATVAEVGLGNLVLLGVGSEPGLFFQRDVLRSLHAKVGSGE